MPRRNFKRTSIKRRRRYRSRSRFRKRRRYNKVARPLLTKQKCKMRYYDQFVLNPGLAGSPAVYIFSANGLYDSNVTGVGHQPLGFDQMMAMYDHSTVIASKINVSFQNTDPNNACVVAITAQDNNVATLTAAEIIENGHTRWTTIGTKGSGKEITNLGMKCNPNKYLSISNPLSDSTVKNSIVSNPAEQVYYLVYAFPNTSGVDATDVLCTVTIDYTVILTEPKKLSIS